MKDNLIIAIKGFIMGIANVIPGVSGGTLALTLGIYEQFIQAISHFFSKIKENLKFLIPLGIGMVLSIITMSRVIDYSYNNFPVPTTLFFMGLVIGGIPLLLKKVNKKKELKKPSNYIIGLITFSIVMLLALSEILFDIDMKVSLNNLSFGGYTSLFIVGCVAAATMVIPGVSGSLVLMLLGYYYPIIEVIKNITKFNNLGENILIALVFGAGVLLGIVLVAKLIEYLLNKFETKTYFGVLGFIIASVIAIPLATYNNVENIIFNVWHLLFGVIILIVGLVIGYKLGEK